MPKISVIVAIYNAQKYLQRCINSILNQSFNDFEILLINDGSTDESRAICDEYALMDSRVRVFHKKNGGVASARQMGINHAIGDYSIHVDPDDWVESDMLLDMYNKAIEENSDMVMCDYYEDTSNSSIYKSQETGTSSSEVLHNLANHRLMGSLCNKLIRSACYINYDISFTEGLNYCEDYLVCVKLLMSNIKTSYLRKAYYHYDRVTNKYSITQHFNAYTLAQRKLFITTLETLNIPNEHKDLIDQNKLQIKFEIFKTNMRKNFYDTYPEVNDRIREVKTSKINRILLEIARIGMFRVAFCIYELKNRLWNIIKI